MPATNEEFIKKAFESGLTEDQVRAAVAERNQRSQGSPEERSLAQQAYDISQSGILPNAGQLIGNIGGLPFGRKGRIVAGTVGRLGGEVMEGTLRGVKTNLVDGRGITPEEAKQDLVDLGTEGAKGLGSELVGEGIGYVGGKALGVGKNLTGKAITKVGEGIKEINPFNVVGKRRATAVKALEDAGVTIDQTKVAEKILNYVETDAPVTMKKSMERYALDAIDKFKNPNASISKTLVDLNAANESAFLQSGREGRAAAARFEKVVGDAIRDQIDINAPDVAAANKAFERLFGAKRQLGKLAFPARIAGGFATGQGVASAVRALSGL